MLGLATQHDLGICQVRRLAKTRRVSVSLQVGIVQPSPAPSALALAPRPCWERLFSSSHGELGRAGFTRTAVFTQHFFCMRFMPFRLKSIRKDKLFQAVGRKHNAWLPFHEARPAEVTTSPATGMVEEIQQASGVSLGASMRSQQCTHSPAAWCVCTPPQPGWLSILTPMGAD